MPAVQRNETMRIGGQKVTGDAGSLEVFNPYNNEIVGTVPRASRGQVQQALQIAKDFKPRLTRYERQQILTKTADLLVSRRDEISDLITAEAGLSKRTLCMKWDVPSMSSVSLANFASSMTVRSSPVT